MAALGLYCPMLAAKVRSARYNRCNTQCAEPSEKLTELAMCTAQATFVRSAL